jgi:phosphatidate cytidylyltransferase
MSRRRRTATAAASSSTTTNKRSQSPLTHPTNNNHNNHEDDSSSLESDEIDRAIAFSADDTDSSNIITSSSKSKSNSTPFNITSLTNNNSTNNTNTTTHKSNIDNDTVAFKGLVPLPESRLRKILTRAAAAFAMIGAFLFIVFRLGHLAVCALIVVLQTMIFRELVALRYITVKSETADEFRWFRTIQWLWFMVAMIYAYGSSYLKAPMGALEQLKHVTAYLNAQGVVDELSFLQAVSFALYSIVFTLTVLTFRKGLYRIQLIQLTWTALTLGVVVAQLKFAVYMVHEGLFWFLFPVSLVVANDTFAYFSGMAFGRRFIKQPLIQLSPNKTWEGFVGGLICTVMYGVIGAPLWGKSKFLRCSFRETAANTSTCFSDYLFENTTIDSIFPTPIQKHAVFFALFASIVAPFGGFFASAIKRAFKIKDFDSILPGHGGVTDRMDCQMIMSLFAYVYYTSFIASLHLKTPLVQILSSLEYLTMEEKQELFGKLQSLIRVG